MTLYKIVTVVTADSIKVTTETILYFCFASNPCNIIQIHIQSATSIIGLHIHVLWFLQVHVHLGM